MWELGGARSTCSFLLALPGLLPLRLQFMPFALQRIQAIKEFDQRNKRSLLYEIELTQLVAVVAVVPA